jgi:PilZ domain
MTNEVVEQRQVPRFPLPKEKMKFVFEEGEKIFAVRDISTLGLGISLLEFGESLLFPAGYTCRAELKLDDETLLVGVKVARVAAWGVGFTFEGLSTEQQRKIQEYVNPLHIAHSLKQVDPAGAPDAFLRGMSNWYHGDSGVDLFFWGGKRGGVNRALFCFGRRFWEWDESEGVATGDIQRLEGDNVVLCKDSTPDPRIREMVRKLLEHAEVLDYRLVSFLKEKT